MECDTRYSRTGKICHNGSRGRLEVIDRLRTSNSRATSSRPVIPYMVSIYNSRRKLHPLLLPFRQLLPNALAGFQPRLSCVCAQRKGSVQQQILWRSRCLPLSGHCFSVDKESRLTTSAFLRANEVYISDSVAWRPCFTNQNSQSR